MEVWKAVFLGAPFGTKQIFRAQRLISVGLVLVFSLTDGETNGSEKVCESNVRVFSTKLSSFI